MSQERLRDVAISIFLGFYVIGFAAEKITESTTPMFVLAATGLVLGILSVPFNQWREKRKSKEQNKNS